MTRQKKLTFKQIAPNWARAIDNLRDTPTVIEEKNGRTHELGNPACCVVGEAYGWNDDYDNRISKKFCSVCTHFSMRFWHKCRESCFYGEEQSSLKMIIKQFVAHWNRKHI